LKHCPVVKVADGLSSSGDTLRSIHRFSGEIFAKSVEYKIFFGAVFFGDLLLGEGDSAFDAFRFLGVRGDIISWCVLSDLMTIGEEGLAMLFLVDRRDMMVAMALDWKE
jgi:hypothetical protein